MKSLHAGTYWGIPVKIHWTFSLIFLVLMGAGWYNGSDTIVLLSYALFIILMFVCVILHEYGHALMAKKYGVKTLDIIISPIGGIARLQKLPEKPRHELAVAIAGPLVNLVIALILFLVALTFFTEEAFTNPDESLDLIASPQGFIALLIWTNCILFAFNLIPAFPMDGGRILRAFLAMKYGKVTGTKYASLVGRALAGLFILIGLFSQHIMLIFIGVFVFVMAKSENKQVLIKSSLSKASAKDIMKTDYCRLHLSNTMREVFDKYIRGGEKNYIVFDSMGNVSGVLPESYIKESYRNDDLDKTVKEYMSNDIYFAESDMTLDKLHEDINVKHVAIAIIKNGDQIQGVIDRQMLFNFIQLQMTK